MITDWEEVRRGVRMCLRKLSLHDSHDDVEQEAMLNAFLYQHTYRGDAALSTWGYSIARSAAMKFFQDRRREIVVYSNEAPVAYSEEATDTEEGLTQDVVFERYAEQLFQAVLANVSEEWLPRFVDRYLIGLRYREIAAKYGIPVGTVQSSLSRMRSAIKSDLVAISLVFDKECTTRVVKHAMEKVNAHLQKHKS